MKPCAVSCYWHGAATFAVQTQQANWLRANLPKLVRVARLRWGRCTCGLMDRVQEVIRGN